MTLAVDIPAALLALPALSLAAGLDLYLTLLLLGLLPHTGLWPVPLPGGLGDLDSVGVHLMVGGFYFLEVVAERWPPSALVWNAFHAVIRPLAGVLLALLLLEGQPLEVVVGGAALAGLLASMAHGVRTGTWVLLWLRGARTPNRMLLSLAEDVSVVALVSLTLDDPVWSSVTAVLLIAALLVRAPSDLRAFRFAILLGAVRAFGSLQRPGWTRMDDFPAWLEAEFADDLASAPATGLKGSPAAALALPGAPRFARGWLVMLGDAPWFAYRSAGRPQRIALGGLSVRGVVQRPLFRGVQLQADSTEPVICVSRADAGLPALRAAFRVQESASSDS